MKRSVLLPIALLGVGSLVACGGPVKKGPPQTLIATFAFTGGAQTFVVPNGVHSVTVDAYGAQGGDNNNPINSPTLTGGKGGRTTAVVAVAPGDVLSVHVGGAGGSNDFSASCDKPAGGFNGGGSGGATQQPTNSMGGGGGASDVRRNGIGLEHRVVVAGGGGGGDTQAGGQGDGGVGGGPEGTAGNNGLQVTGGGGGTQTSGGAGGTGNPTTFNGGTGTAGQGGEGGGDVSGCPDPSFTAGGGGGGGFYGGGGAGGDAGNAGGAGGGGGSSFGPPGAVFENGVRSGNGLVVIGYRA